MNTRTLLKTTILITAIGLAYPVTADPVTPTSQTDLTAARIVLASLQRDLEVPTLWNLSPRNASPDIVQAPKAEEDLLIQIAGRCGSSNKYCNSPGFTYCCGNSTDGFYCAANVNGCTK